MFDRSTEADELDELQKDDFNRINSGENAEEQPKKATGSAWIVHAFAATFFFSCTNSAMAEVSEHVG